MALLSPKLIDTMVAGREILQVAYKLLTEDVEVANLWYMSNAMVVNRLKYNDHGPIHAKIVAGAALYLYHLLRSSGVESTLIRDGVVETEEYTWLVPLIGGLLHDIGNSVHREMHERIGAILAKPIVDRVLEKIIPEASVRIRLRQEILHAIFCTDYELECLTVEAGCVKVGDGLDMAEGRARVPYRLGGVSIHSISALSIKKVEIMPSDKRPIRVNVHMSEKAGIFQVDEIFLPKLKKTPLKDYVEVYVLVGDNVLKTYP